MAKVCFFLVALCGLASLSVAEPSSTMYGSPATPAKYPAPATYPAPAPAPAKYETPAPTKYETPTTTAKYEAPTPAKYEAAPKYEEKKEEYPMKMEYKTEEKPMEYKKEEKMEYKKETYPKKMEYGGKKYRRSIDEDAEESHSDPMRRPMMYKLTPTDLKAVRDAVISKLLSAESDPVRRPAKAGILTDLFKFLVRDENDFIMASDPVRRPATAGILTDLFKFLSRDEDDFTMASDPVRRGGKSKFAGQLAGNLAGGVLGGLLNDENCWRVGLSRKQAKVVRDAVMTKLVMESDPAFRKSFGKTFAREGAGAVGSFIGSKIRGGDAEDLVQMYGRDPARRKFLKNVASNFGAGVVGGLLGNEEALSMEELDDMMDDMDPGKRRWW
ncbi:uncharacterized protein LOC124203858 isoform X1 [Daphnia pulex]|uniref:uncharacterized protein LOC124203858 isoform X1 n=1 Tax=Daphnia pulex TaxID=6669 RepID=UPI001EDCBB61|nr:uncharacterized protein LOC124203858 isoform X1 [Daphnia pulex]